MSTFDSSRPPTDPADYDVFRERAGAVKNGGRIMLKPYGWLEGVMVKLSVPVENFDASKPYFLIVTLARVGDSGPVDTNLVIQTACRTVGGKFQSGAYPSEEPIL